MADPFFRYYGSKHRGARHFCSPVRDLVIEPFAGSACYSTFWNCPNVLLYDIYEPICELWDWLIKCSVDDIKKIPDRFEDDADLVGITGGARHLLGFWLFYGCPKPIVKTGVWYNSQKDIQGNKAGTWGIGAKARIIRQKPLIENWKIECLSYDKIPNAEAHWFIDPPYNNKARKAYAHNCNAIDYEHLGQWCRERAGAVQVCENEGADWLPFEPLYVVQAQNKRKGKAGKPSHEVVWERGINRIGKLI